MVHTSSIAALGRLEGAAGMTDETIGWKDSRANSPYGISKRDAELQVHRGIAEGLEVVMVNPSVIFGPGRARENTMQIYEAVTSGYLPFFPGGGVNVVDVEDVARGHMLAMQHGRSGERYILGGENLQWEAIFRMIAEAAGVSAPKWKLPPALAIGLTATIQYGALLFGTKPTD